MEWWRKGRTTKEAPLYGEPLLCLYGVLSGVSTVVLCTSGITYLMLVLLHHLFLFGVIGEWEWGFVLMILGRSETLLKVEVSVLAADFLVVVSEYITYMVLARI